MSEQIELGDFARGYAFGRLEACNGLAKATMALWSTGIVGAIVPPGTNTPRAHEFSRPFGVGNGYTGWLAEHLGKWTGSGPSYFIIQDTVAGASDLEKGTRPPPPYVDVEGVPYYYMALPSRDMISVRELVFWMPSFVPFFACIMADLPDDLAEPADIDRAIRGADVRFVREMFLNVYDGEGWLTWRGRR